MIKEATESWKDVNKTPFFILFLVWHELKELKKSGDWFWICTIRQELWGLR